MPPRLKRTAGPRLDELLDNQRDVTKSTYGASELAQERQEQKELGQKNAIKIIVCLVQCLHWPIDEVSDAFRDEVATLTPTIYYCQ